MSALVATSALFSVSAEAATIAQVYSGGTTGGNGGTAVYSLTGTVTGILSVASTTDTFVVQDGTGSVLLYNITKANYTPTLGDNISFNATDAPYQGAPELTNTAFTLTATNSTGNAASPTILTVPQFNSAGGGSTASGGTGTAVPPLAEAIITLNSVTLPSGTTSLNTSTNTAYTLTDSLGNTTILYSYKSYTNTLAALNAANAQESASGNTFYAGPLTITGYADVFNGVSELYPLSIVPEPSSNVMLGLGFAGVALVAVRTRRARRA